jgi:solute carrier family 7 (L-type amino acid transporter), member 6
MDNDEPLTEDAHGSDDEALDIRLSESRPLRFSDDSHRESPPAAVDAVSKGSKGLTFWHGLGLVISLQIGSGIFIAPAQISRNVVSPGYGVLVWALAGLLAWTGAASFIELGMAIPLNGGIQEYLRVCYGDFMACIFTWTWIFISKAAANAAIATIFGEYICSAFAISSSAARNVLGLLGLWTVFAANWTGARAGATIAVYFLFLKISLISVMVTMGLVAAARGDVGGINGDLYKWFQPDPKAEPPPPISSQSANAVAALFGALFTLNGWESVSADAGKEPSSPMTYVVRADIIRHRRHGRPGKERTTGSPLRHGSGKYSYDIVKYLPLYHSPFLADERE